MCNLSAFCLVLCFQRSLERLWAALPPNGIFPSTVAAHLPQRTCLWLTFGAGSCAWISSLALACHGLGDTGLCHSYCSSAFYHSYLSMRLYHSCTSTVLYCGGFYNWSWWKRSSCLLKMPCLLHALTDRGRHNERKEGEWLLNSHLPTSAMQLPRWKKKLAWEMLWEWINEWIAHIWLNCMDSMRKLCHVSVAVSWLLDYSVEWVISLPKCIFRQNAISNAKCINANAWDLVEPHRTN